MGATVSVRNQTPYTWQFYNGDRTVDRTLSAWQNSSYEEQRLIHRYINLRCLTHSGLTFRYEFNTHKGDATFTLSESFDRSQITLHCSSEGGTHYRSNYPKLEEDQRQQEQERKRQEEERRRKEDERRRQQQEQERRRQEDERRRQEQEHRRQEEERRKQQEQERRRKEEERRRQEEERRRQQQEQERRKQEDERHQQEQEHRRQEERRRKQQEQERRRQEEERRRQEEERRRQQQELERRRQEEQRRREQEELRRQERLERERRIQQEIDRQNEVCKQKLSDAKEKLKQKQSFKGQERHHQRTHVLHQLVEDDAAAIERDEPVDVEEMFKGLLSKYSIDEDEIMTRDNVEERMKRLQNELLIQYCKEKRLPIWFPSTFDKTIGYEDLSLTDKFNLVEAVVQLTVESNSEPSMEDILESEFDMKNHFLLNLLRHLYAANQTLASNLLLSLIGLISQLSATCKDILSQMVFNNLWTPVEIMLFIQSVSDMDQNKIKAILHTAQTYRLDCPTAVSALDKDDPVKHLEEHGTDELKDVDTILEEMQESNYPENILLALEEVLKYLESELPKYTLTDLSEQDIEDVKQKIKSLDFDDLNMDSFQEVLIGMSIAVQDCTTIWSKGEKIEGYFPRLTQLASLIMLLLQDKGSLLEIGTGEGKSCILAMFATIQAIRGVKVDVVTSSPVLAIRDQEEWEKLYTKFGVTSSVVPPRGPVENYEVEVERAYSKEIIFGTVGTFAADILKQEFERRPTRGSRDFELVIVDEVDYMTLDNGVQVTFLSHEASGMRHIEQVLANIWAVTSSCRPIELLETGEIQWTSKIQHFHKVAFSAVNSSFQELSAFDILLPGLQMNLYSADDIEQLKCAETQSQSEGQSQELQDQQWKAMESFMEKIGIAEQYDLLHILELATGIQMECYSLTNNKAKLHDAEKTDDDKVKMLMLENGRAGQILSEREIIDATVSLIKSKTKYCDKMVQNDEDQQEQFMKIPLFLKTYLETTLPVFVENALKAIRMTPGREYMIDKGTAAEVDNASSDDHQYHAIIPVDFKASGVLEKNKRWGDGLQQFLEMKHQLSISQMSNVTNYMSNFHYFKRYINGKGIFGVSGTLGGQADQKFLAKHYKVRSYPIPAHRQSKRIELPVIQVSGGNNVWLQRICETVCTVAERGQVVLVICEDVKTANELQTKMQTKTTKDPNKLTMYTVSGRHDVEKKKFDGGNIIIATNLGGRGTDIKVDSNVNRCGGLFVLLTHFPSNRRVEKQVFGRTARKGNPGMVQMMLCRDHLAPAYQGQSIEVMRDLRAKYEVSRIADMEKDELLEIEMKEELFSTFCLFLSEFDGNYSEEERKDTKSTSGQNSIKFDYQPALNALKESWALWLTVHEEHINRHDDIEKLKPDLLHQLETTGDMLLQGKSDNFYDHIKQAIIRTDLYCRKRSEDSYGAFSCWQTIVEFHEMYSAVALYNQAFITINLRKKGYMSNAKQLLERADTLVDVHVSETTNAMASCNMSATSDFEPHHKNGTNFQKQMEARMNIFNSWKLSIKNAINKLEELDKAKDDAITEESSVYTLSEEKDYLNKNELGALYDYGLGIVFEVKKKPKFSFDALICFIIGVLQVVAGILVVALSFGTFLSFGVGLISEGVSDMISGIKGMIDGSFSWAEWAISKAISIGMSLLCAGFNAGLRAIKGAYNTGKALIKGTTTFASVADEIINSGKHAFNSIKETAKSAFSGTLRETMTKMTSSTVLKQNFLHATKYACQEIGKQAVTSALNYAVDVGVQEFFKKMFQDAVTDEISSALKSNTDLDKGLTSVACFVVPKAVLQKQTPDFKIDKKNEEGIKDIVASGIANEYLVSGYTTAHQVIGRLSQVSAKVDGIIKNKGIVKGISVAIEIAEYTTIVSEIRKTTQTKDIINEKLVPTFLDTMSQQIHPYDQDGRHNLPDVQRLKNDLLNIIIERVSKAFIDALAGHMTSYYTKELKKHVGPAAGEAVSNVLGRYKTQSFFDDQTHKQNMKKGANQGKPLTEEERTELHDYSNDISNENRQATAVDLYALTKTELLDGKGIRFTVVDEKGRKLSEEFYPGTKGGSGEITLRLTKESLQPKTGIMGLVTSLEKRVFGQDNPYTGHFDIVQSDGSITPVESKKQSCLYHAIVQATDKRQGEAIQERATKLRGDVQKEVQSNLDEYGTILKLQKGYEQTCKNTGKYVIVGGNKRPREDDNKQQGYEQAIKPMQDPVVNLYHLGFVGNGLKNLRGKRQRTNIADVNSPVNADHVPPKSTFQRAYRILEENPQKSQNLKEKNPKLYGIIQNTRNDARGDNLLAMEVLTSHHRQALTTGRYLESQRCRELVCNSAMSGDGEKMIKLSLILAHPMTSQNLREDAGIHRQRLNHSLSEGATRGYYKIGNLEIVKQYGKLGVIGQNQRDTLLSWVQEDGYLNPETPEYKECLDTCINAKAEAEAKAEVILFHTAS